MKTLKVIILVLLLSTELKAQQWYQMGNMDTTAFITGKKFVQKITFYNNKITVGGGFKKITHGPVLNGVAQWNNGNWQPMGLGVWWPFDFATVPNDSAGNGGGGLAEFRGGFYSVGTFTGAGGTSIDLNNTPHLVYHMARWDGVDWYPLLQVGGGVHFGANGNCMALKVYHDNLYVGGYFNRTGDSAGLHITDGIARWNDTVFSAVGQLAGDFPPNQENTVLDFCEFQDKLIVGGWFTSIDGSPYGSYSGIAAWNDTAWSPIGVGFNDAVASVTVYNGELYAAGMFTATRDNLTPLNHVAKWNGTNWQAVGEGLGVNTSFTDSVMVLYVDSLQNKLYAGGNFTHTGLGATAKHLAEWTGTHWQEVGGGTNNKVLTMYAKDSTLYVGGFFTEVGGWLPAHFIAAWGRHPVGVEEIRMDETGVAIYPNPTTNQFTIENSQLRINSIHIYNVLGELVQSLKLESLKLEVVIDVSTWKAGVYFVEVETEKGVVRRKVIKSTMY